MFYVSTESVSDRKNRLVVIRNTDDSRFRIDIAGEHLGKELYEREIDIDEVVGLYRAEYSNFMCVSPVSGVEAGLLEHLEYIGVDTRPVSARLGWCTSCGNWHYRGFAFKPMSLAKMLFKGCDENMQVALYNIRISEENVSVQTGTEGDKAFWAVYDIKDYNAFCSGIVKYQMFRPVLPSVESFEVMA